jgi:hypothetical protein
MTPAVKVIGVRLRLGPYEKFSQSENKQQEKVQGVGK